MTGWLGVDSVSSCCCCELCQPVRCVIDQHEVEIVPATHRSTSSSLAPTTHRTHWSTSSSNTLPSSRTLISEGSIPRAHTRQLRLREPAAYCATTVDPHSVVKTTRRHSNHGQRQGAGRTGSHNSQTSAPAADTHSHQQRQPQSTPHVNVKTSDQERSRNHRLLATGKKLRPRKTSRAEEREKEHRAKAGSGKGSTVLPHRGPSRATCSDQPFQLFEQDPQHDASFPEDSQAIRAEEKEHSVLNGAAFASVSARTQGNSSEEAVDVLTVASECPHRSQQCDADSGSGVPFSRVSVTWSRNGSGEKDNRSVCGHSPTDLIASHMFQGVQIPHLVLNQQHLSRQLLMHSSGQQLQMKPDNSNRETVHSASSVRTSVPQDENRVHCSASVCRDKGNSAGVSTERGVQSSHCCPVAASQATSKDADGGLRSGETEEGDPSAVPAALRATVKKRHACDYATGIQVRGNRSCACRGTTTAAPATAEGERITDKWTRGWQSKRPSQVRQRSTGTDDTFSVKVLCGTLSRGPVPFCSTWTGCERKAVRVQTASFCKNDTGYSLHSRKTGGVAGASPSAIAAASVGACATTCSGTSENILQKIDSRNLEPLPREYYPWFTKSPPDCEIFFYDSSIGCADGLGCSAIASGAATDMSFVTPAETGSALQTDTQEGGTFCDRDRKCCVTGDRQQPQPQAKVGRQVQHADLADVAVTTTAIAGSGEQPWQSSFWSRARCALRQAFYETQGKHQQMEPHPRLGGTSADPDDVTLGAASHAHGYQKPDCQQQHTPQQARHNAQALLGNKHQQERNQQHQDGNMTPSEGGRSRPTAGEMQLLVHTNKVKHETEDSGPQERRQSAVRFLISNAAQLHASPAAGVLLPLENIPFIPRTSERKEQVCLSLAHLQGLQQCQHKSEDGSQDRCNPTAAAADCASGTYDIWRLRRNRNVPARGKSGSAILEKCVTGESGGSSSSSASCSLYCLSSSSVSTQGQAIAVQPHTREADSGLCYGVTPFLCSLVASSSVSASPEEASKEHPAQQRQEQSVCTARQQPYRRAQQQEKGAVKSPDDDPDGFTSSCQSADAASFYLLTDKVEEAIETRLVLLPSPFSTEVSCLPTHRGCSVACEYLVQHSTRQTEPGCNNICGDKYIKSETSGTRNRINCVCLKATNTTKSIGGDRSRSNWKSGCVTTFNTRSRQCGREDKGNRVTYSVSTNTDSSTGSTVSAGRRTNSLNVSECSAVCKFVEAHATLECNAAKATADHARDNAHRSPLFSDNLPRRCCDVEKASGKQFSSSTVKVLVSRQSLKSDSAHRSPFATKHCLGDRLSETVSPALSPRLITSCKIADVACSLKRDSWVSTVDRDALLRVQPKKAHEPLEKKEREESEHLNGEDSQDRLQGTRFVGSKLKHSGKEVGEGLLSKGARLVLWQSQTNSSSSIPPAHLVVS